MWIFTFFTAFEIWDTLWGCFILIYKDIQCRWVKRCRWCVKPYNSRTTTPRAILTAARVGRYDHITPIYIPPYAVPPATLIPGSRVSGLTGSQGSRVTGHHGSQGHHGHGSYRVTGSLGYRVYYPRFLHCPYLQGHHGHRITRVTRSQGHHGLPSPWSWITGSPITREIESPITRVTGLPSPWFRVTYNHGLTTGGCCVWILPAHHL